MTEQGEINNDTQAGLKAVDDLLTELDPAFKEKLNQMNSEIESSGLSGIVLESINISAEYLEQDQNAPKGEDVKSIAVEEKHDEILIKSAHTLGGFLLIGLWQSLIFTFKMIPKVIRFLISIKKLTFSLAFKNLSEDLIPQLKILSLPFLEVGKKLKGYKFGAYLKLVIIVCLFVGMKLLFSDMKKHLNPDGEKDPFLRSWAEEADSTGQSPPEDSDEDIENPQRHPEYTVLIQRILANLKPPSAKASPMISTELYIEASNQDCAIEIHDREQEVRDTLTRVFEESTFSDLDTLAGKERLKVHIRGSLNKFLTKGHVKRVFFSTFNISL